jgi:phosphate transport system protein
MSHYEERLERDIAALREGIAGMAEQVELALANAVLALQRGDHALAATTILADHPINRTMRKIDAACHAFIAVHLPSGKHLRLLSSIIRANIALERIGDYAVIIARASEQLTASPEGHLGRELARFSGEVHSMLQLSCTAFNQLDADLAKRTMVLETEMEFDLDGIYTELMANPEQATASSLLTAFTVFTHLKRAADQAKNLCEDTVFAATGATKAPKVYNILFVDHDNSVLGPMAVAVARKNFPGSGNYTCAGREPAAAVNPATREFLAELGLEPTQASPRALDYTEHKLSEFHVVVSLQGAVREALPQIPFHTTGVDWELGLPVEGTTDPARLRELYRELGTRIGELMHLLRGQDAP